MNAHALFRTLFLDNPNRDDTGDAGRAWKTARIVILAAFIAVNLVFVIFHEPWQDEAQAWLLVTNLDLPSLFSQLKIEGHPALWFLILYPFAKLGAPITVMGFISLAAVSVAAWTMLRRSPFPPAIQVLLLASPLFTYYLPVISRSYSIALLLVVAACALYEDRRSHPILFGAIIALMLQTHVILAGLALGLIVLMIVDAIRGRGGIRKSREWVGIAVACMGMLATYLELRGGPSSGSSANIVLAQISSSPLNVLYRFAYDFAANIAAVDAVPNIVKVIVGLLALAAIFTPLILRPKQCWRAVFLVIMGIGAQLAISVFVYQSAAQRSIFFAAMLMLEGWLVLESDMFAAFDRDKGEAASAAPRAPIAIRSVLLGFFIVFSLCTIPFAWKAGVDDIREPYSGSMDMGSRIGQTIEPGTVVVSACASATEAVIPFASSMVYWNPSANVEFTYCAWGETRDELAVWNEVLDFDDIVARYRRAYPDSHTMYLLADSHFPDSPELDPYLLYEQGDTLYWEETFRLYKVPV